MKTFYCGKIQDDGLLDPDGNPCITLTFKYCSNCLLIPDSPECDEHDKETSEQLERQSGYFVDMRNHPQYNIELTKDIKIPVENMEKLDGEALEELKVLLHLKSTQTIRCSKLTGTTAEEREKEIDITINEFKLVEAEYKKCCSLLKERGFNLKEDNVPPELEDYDKSRGERELLSMSIIWAQMETRMMYFDNDDDE